MPNSYKNGAFALGLIAGIGLVLNLFLWLDLKAQHQANQSPNANNEGGKSEVGKFWDWLIGTFVSASDTLAQWIMAAFTVGAVLLVWRTLVVTRRTLLATQDMARDAREIGEAQVRGYLGFVEGNQFFNTERVGVDVHKGFHLTFQNTGASPLSVQLYDVTCNIVDPKLKKAMKFVLSPTLMTIAIDANCKRDFPYKASGTLSERTLIEVFGSDDIQAIISVPLEALDVFGRTTKIHFMAMCELNCDAAFEGVECEFFSPKILRIDRELQCADSDD